MVPSMAEKSKEELLTAAKWAEKLGISPSKFKKAIEELNIQADSVKGKCSYYGSKTAEKIKKSVKEKRG